MIEVCLQTNYIILDTVSSTLCLCLCTCMCVLSLLAGIPILLKLLFYVHQLIVRVVRFQNCCFYSFPPPLNCQLYFVSQKVFWRAVLNSLWLVSLELQLAFWSSSNIPVSSVWKSGGKDRWKRCFDECVPYFNCLPGKVVGERDIRGRAWKGKHEKILHTKAKYWFLAWERAGWWDPSYQVMTHLVLSLTETIIEVKFKNLQQIVSYQDMREINFVLIYNKYCFIALKGLYMSWRGYLKLPSVVIISHIYCDSWIRWCHGRGSPMGQWIKESRNKTPCKFAY